VGENTKGVGFFFVQAALYERWAALMDRDALILYLLHARGYNSRYSGSLYGAKGARLDGDLSAKRYREAKDKLGALGIAFTHGDRRPMTYLPNLHYPCTSRPLPLGKIEAEDGHAYQRLRDDDLILMPWPLVDGDRSVPEARLGSLECKESMILLLWCYQFAASDGYVLSHRLWLPNAGEMTLTASEAVFQATGLSEEEVRRAGAELLGTGLIYIDGTDSKERGIVRLYYPMDLTDQQPETDLE